MSQTRARTERLLVPVVLGLLATGGLAFLSLSRTWQHATVVSEGLPSDAVEVTGTTAFPAATALALVVLTAGLAILAAGRRTRQGVGVLVVLVSLGAVAMLLTGSGSLDSAFRDAVQKSPAFTGGNAPSDVHSNLWEYLAVAVFVLAGLLGATAARFGARWPTMSGRYDAPGARTQVKDPHDPADLWKALDRGDDPTA